MVAPAPRAPFPPWLSFVVWLLGVGCAAFVAVVLLTGCGASESVPADFQALDDSVKDYAQGCSWRGAPTAEYEPRSPESCNRVFAWLDARLTDHELASPCDAADEPNPGVVRPEHPQMWGYYDRDKLDRFKILRFERLETCP